MKTIIIQGSSLSKGNTYQIVEALRQHIEADVIDLLQYNIHHYDYGHIHQEDDFLPLMRRIVSYDLLVFATPIYWYSMSGLMKVFFDRITDCLKVEKETGRRLRGKAMAAIACGSEMKETEGFFVPFRESAGYLGMRYLGDVHTWIEGDEVEKEVLGRIERFAQRL